MKAKWATALAVIFVFGSAPILAADPVVTVEELVREYDRFELPNVQGDAKLVKYNTFGDYLSFLVKAKSKEDNQNEDIVFRRFKNITLPATTKINVISFTREAVKEALTPKTDSNLLDVVVQCHKLGHVDIAKDLYAFYLKKKSKNDAGPIQNLRKLAWTYWSNQIQSKAADRNQILKHLKEIKRLEPEIDSQSAKTIETLESMLVPRNAKPGSMESLIDALVDDEGERFFQMQLPSWRPTIRKILAQGFDIIPTLIAHLDDRRRTRFRLLTSTGDNPPLLVGSICGMILCEWAGNQFPHTKGNWNEDRMIGWNRLVEGRPFPIDLNPLKRDAVNEWWKETQTTGEKKYLLSKAEETPAQHRYPNGPRYQNMVVLETIASKYPMELKTIYLQEVSDTKTTNHSGYIIDKMLETPALMQQIDKKEMRKLIEPALHHQNKSFRLTAEKAILKLDPKEYADRQLERIKMSNTDDKTFHSLDMLDLLEMSQASDDPRIMPALSQFVHKLPSAQKLSFLSTFSRSEGRKSTLRFFLTFLDDESEFVKGKERKRFGSKLTEDDTVGKSYLFREYVANQIATLLKLNFVMEQNRPGDEWAYIQKWLTDEVAKELKK